MVQSQGFIRGALRFPPKKFDVIIASTATIGSIIESDVSCPCKTLAGPLTHACILYLHSLPLYETLKVLPFVIHCELAKADSESGRAFVIHCDLAKADSESGRASCSELSILALLLHSTCTIL